MPGTARVWEQYLVHLNPAAFVVGIDFVNLAVARERTAGQELIESSSIISAWRCTQVAGEFDLINCVGVTIICQIQSRIQSLATKAPGGLMHIFVYGNWGAGKLN